jgi:hypothetical protein
VDLRATFVGAFQSIDGTGRPQRTSGERYPPERSREVDWDCPENGTSLVKAWAAERSPFVR